MHSSPRSRGSQRESDPRRVDADFLNVKMKKLVTPNTSNYLPNNTAKHPRSAASPL